MSGSKQGMSISRKRVGVFVDAHFLRGVITMHERSLVEGWPALMSLEMAARYLSLDEGSFRKIVARFDVQPVDLQSEGLRWRKIDLDKLVRRLPTVEVVDFGDVQSSAVQIDPAAIEKIAAAVASHLGSKVSGAKPALVSIKDATIILGLGRTTIYRLVNEGRLSTRHIGGRTLIPRTDIESFLVQQ